MAKVELKLVTNAEGRTSPKVDTNDDTAAFHALKVLYNHLEPERADEFRSLLGFFGTPWTSLGVMDHLDTVVDPSGRDEVREELVEAVRRHRQRMGTAPQNPVDAAGESRIARLVARSQEKVLALARSWDGPAQLLRDARSLEAPILQLGIDVPGYYGFLQTLSEFRVPGESLREAFDRVAPFYHSNEAAGVHSSVELIALVTAGFPEDPGEALSALGEALAEAAERFPDSREVAVELTRLALEKDRPFEAILGLAESYQLTGDPAGFDKLHDRLEGDLAAGRFPDGDAEQLKEQLLRNLRLQRLIGTPAEDAPASAYAELLKNARSDDGTAIRKEDGVVWVGGIPLKIRER